MPVLGKNNKIEDKPKGCFRIIRTLFVITIAAVLLFFGAQFGINGIVIGTTTPDIKTQEQVEQASESFDAQAIVVLGAGINYDGTPSTILQDRLDVAISLYNKGVAPKIIMSGDNSESSYNEVMAMCIYAAKQGVSRDDIFCDHAGVSTYDSMYRLCNVFNVTRCVIVTQEYHLYRTLYDAHAFGIKTYGVASDLHTYSGMDEYEKREFLARIQDFGEVILNKDPEKKSSPVSLNQSGRVTQWW